MSELKTAYGGQTPKHDDVDVESFEDLIRSASRLVESVYNNFNNSRMSVTSPESTAARNLRSPNSLRTPRQLEIERINRFCESLDEDMPRAPTRRLSANTETRRSASPSILLQAENVRENMNTAILQLDDNEATGRGNGTVLASSRRNSEQRSHDIAFIATDSSGVTLSALASADFNNSDTTEVIDLSNIPSTMETTVSFAPRRRSVTLTSPAVRALDDDDDDVIIVSSNLVDIVDLCTPVREPLSHRCGQYRRSNPPVHLNDRSRSPSVTTAARSVQTSTTHIQQPQQQRQLLLSKSPSSTDASGGGAMLSLSDSSLDKTLAGNERPILMCPVCMESSVKRKPTSTKCGHVFCESCIQRALLMTHKCPMCNKKLTNKMLFRIYL